MIFKLGMWDDKHLSLEIASLNAQRFQEVVELIREFPERRYLKDYKIWRIPVTQPNLNYLATFDPAEYVVDPEAKTLLRYEELTKRRASRKRANRWEYLFNDQVPDVPYAESITEPFKHQIVALDAIHDTEYFGLLMEMGTGKTKVIVDECFWQAKQRMGDPPFKVLVVCPKTVMDIWIHEFEKHANPNIPYWIEKIGTQGRGIKQITQGIKSRVPLKIFVTAFDRITSMKDVYARLNLNFMVLDESTRIKNRRAKRTKACLALADHVERRAILTGAPLVNNILDLWSQFEFLQPGSLGYSSFSQYRERYASYRKLQGGHKKITGPKRLEELKHTMAMHSFVVTKDQCLDLPPKSYQTRAVEMTPKQRDLYEQMIEFFVASLAGKESVAKVAITQILRLAQICSGYLPDVGDFSDAKLLEVEEVVGESNGPILIWARFRHDIKKLEQWCKKKKIPYGTLYGGTKDVDRYKNIKAFNEGRIKILIGQPGAGGIGVTLLGPEDDRCHTVIYYSNDFALEPRIQSEDRCHRIGQTVPVTYIDIVCENSIDLVIARALQNKRDLSEYIKDMTSIKELLIGK